MDLEKKDHLKSARNKQLSRWFFFIFILSITFMQDMEKNVQGYKALRQEIKDLRWVAFFTEEKVKVFGPRTLIDQQHNLREKFLLSKPERTKYYKSQLKVR